MQNRDDFLDALAAAEKFGELRIFLCAPFLIGAGMVVTDFLHAVAFVLIRHLSGFERLGCGLEDVVNKSTPNLEREFARKCGLLRWLARWRATFRSEPYQKLVVVITDWFPAQTAKAVRLADIPFRLPSLGNWR